MYPEEQGERTQRLKHSNMVIPNMKETMIPQIN